MKKFFLLISILYTYNFSLCQVISDKIDNLMIVKNKVKSVTHHNTIDSIFYTVMYDRFGHVVRFSQKPYLFGNKSELIKVFDYKDTLISRSILFWIKNDSIIRNDTSYYEYDKNNRLEFITKKDNKNKGEAMTQFIYVSSDLPPTNDPNLKLFNQVFQKRNYGLIGEQNPIGNRIVKRRDGKKYLLDNYEIYHYSPYEIKPYATFFYAYNNFPNDTSKAMYELLEYEKTFIWGDTLIQKIGFFSVPNVDMSVNTNSDIYNVPGNSFDGPMINYMKLIHMKNGKPIHLISQSFRNSISGGAHNGTEDYEYFPNGLIKKSVSILHGNMGNGNSIRIEETYQYQFY